MPEQARHIRSHLVPKCYLTRFADDRQQLQVYERLRNIPPYLTSVTNVAVERDFYIIETAEGTSQEVEHRLAEIEGHSCAALRRLGDDVWPMSVEDRDWLANFIALQLTRGRPFRDMQQRLANEALGLLGRAQAAHPEGIRRILGEEATDENVEEAGSVLREGQFTVTPDQSQSVVGAMQVAGTLVQPISDKCWNLLKADAQRIVTSDAPVTLWRAPWPNEDVEGIGVLTAEEIALPVDPQHVLILQPPGPDAPAITMMDSTLTATLNWRTIHDGHRQVYAHPATLPSP